MEDRERAGDYVEGVYLEADWDATEDLTALSGAELSERLEELVRQERKVSYRRRMLHGEIDLIRAELVRRGAEGAAAEDLALALASALWRGTGDPGVGQ